MYIVVFIQVAVAFGMIYLYIRWKLCKFEPTYSVSLECRYNHELVLLTVRLACNRSALE